MPDTRFAGRGRRAQTRLQCPQCGALSHNPLTRRDDGRFVCPLCLSEVADNEMKREQGYLRV
jgi:uncharacterized Zn finger protein (UPF0148 family)